MLDPFRRAGWCGWAILVVVLILVPAGCWVSQARAQTPPAPPPVVAVEIAPAGCQQLVDLVSMGTEARDAGVRLSDLLLRLERTVRLTGDYARQIVYRELRQVYASGLPAAVLELDVRTRCMTGPMPLGEDT